jgi:hypothetical protein
VLDEFIGVTLWGVWGDRCAAQIFFIPKYSFLATELKEDKKDWGESGGKDVCMLRTGSNQTSPSF